MTPPVRSLLLLLLVTGFAIAPRSAAAGSYDEAVSGDISGDRLAPTSLALDPGSNPISGTVIAGDIDYLTLHVSAGQTLAQLVLTSFVSADDLAFMAIQSGTQFTEPPTGTNVANLLGWSHVSLPTGTDYLALMGGGSGAIGFSGPLPAGDYTLWIQQANPQLVAYSFDAVVGVSAPEPVALALLALAGAGLAAARPRRVT
jgi:hypothetical protein